MLGVVPSSMEELLRNDGGLQLDAGQGIALAGLQPLGVVLNRCAQLEQGAHVRNINDDDVVAFQGADPLLSFGFECD
jgi:hypothetical protein